MDNAGTALAGIAADMGACQPEMIAKELNEQGAALDIAGGRLAVHCHGNSGHFLLPVEEGRLQMPRPFFSERVRKAYRRDHSGSTVIVSKTRAKSLFSAVYNE